MGPGGMRIPDFKVSKLCCNHSSVSMVLERYLPSRSFEIS